MKALELSNEEQKKLLHVSKKFVSYMHPEQVLCPGIMVDLDHMYVYLCMLTGELWERRSSVYCKSERAIQHP